LGPIVREAHKGPVTATVHMRPRTPRFGDRIHLVIDIQHTPQCQVEELDLGARLGHLRVRGREGPNRVDEHRLRYVLSAEAERTGVNIVRFPALFFTVLKGEGAGKRHKLPIPTLEIQVAGWPKGQEPKLKDLGTPLLAVSLPARRRSLFFWHLTAAVLTGLLLFLHLATRRAREREVAPPAVDPKEEARLALEWLLSRGHIEAGRFGLFYLELTGIVRRFIERTTGLRAAEETTEEFLRELPSSEAFDRPQQEALKAFLEAADLVKFAAQIPSGSEVEGAVDAARRFCGLLVEEGKSS